MGYCLLDPGPVRGEPLRKRIDSLLQQADAHYNAGFYESSAKAFGRVAQMARDSLHDDSLHLLTQLRLGDVYRATHNYSTALVRLKKSRKAVRQHGYTALEAYANERLASVYYELDRMDSVISYSRQVLELAQTAIGRMERQKRANPGNPGYGFWHHRRNLAYILLAAAQRRLGDVDTCLRILHQARHQLDERLPSVFENDYPMLLQHFAMSFRRMPQGVDSMLFYARRAYATAMENDVLIHQREGARHLAAAYKANGQLDSALFYLTQKQELSQKFNDLKLKSRMAELSAKYQLEQREKENQLLKAQNQLQATKLHKQRLYLAMAGGFLLVVGISGFLLWRSKRKLQRQYILITEQKEEIQRHRDQLQQAQAQLVENEKLASLGRLVAGVAHEINNPVGIGVSAASHLEQETHRIWRAVETRKLSSREFTEYMKTAQESSGLILRNLERAAQLVNSFKEVAADQTSEASRRFELNHYLREIVSSLSAELRRRQVEVHYRLSEEACPLESYPGVFAQIVTNLVMNALLHAFPEKPEFTPVIEIGSRNIPDYGVGFWVKDNGCGIPTALRERLFEPFFTTARGEGGSGLGLSVVRNLVNRQLEGRVVLRSEEGVGSCFEIQVPSQTLRASEPYTASA